ncbi:MAG: hypothetical protein ACLPWS_04145 [Rhodomicrobium sp.]
MTDLTNRLHQFDALKTAFDSLTGGDFAVQMQEFRDRLGALEQKSAEGRQEMIGVMAGTQYQLKQALQGIDALRDRIIKLEEMPKP